MQKCEQRVPDFLQSGYVVSSGDYPVNHLQSGVSHLTGCTAKRILVDMGKRMEKMDTMDTHLAEETVLSCMFRNIGRIALPRQDCPNSRMAIGVSRTCSGSSDCDS